MNKIDFNPNNVSKNIRAFWSGFQNKELYFERWDYAHRFLKMLKKNNDSFALFQQRRKGKTSFLTNEFAKLSSIDSYVFYFSFIEETKPHENVFLAFKKSLIDFSLNVLKGEKDNIEEKILKKKKENGLSFDFEIATKGLIDVGLKLNKESNKTEEVDFLEKLKTISLSDVFYLIDSLADKKIILILDEFQEIGKGIIENEEAESFVKGLRTCLDVRRGTISAIFTGSDYSALEDFFTKYNSVFFEFGVKLKLEDFGNDFVEFCLNSLNKDLPENKQANLEDLKKAFEKMDKLPSALTGICSLMGLNQDNNPFNYIEEFSFKKKQNSTLDLKKSGENILKELKVIGLGLKERFFNKN